MKASRVRFPLVAAIVVGIGAALALALPAGAAVSLQSQSPPTAAVSLGNIATLDARGAVIFQPVGYTCAPDVEYGYLDVRVTEAVGKDIAQGVSEISIDLCTGAVQHATIGVVPSEHPFRRGVAYAEAVLVVCNRVTCVQFRDQHNVRIR